MCSFNEILLIVSCENMFQTQVNTHSLVAVSYCVRTVACTYCTSRVYTVRLVQCSIFMYICTYVRTSHIVVYIPIYIYNIYVYIIWSQLVDCVTHIYIHTYVCMLHAVLYCVRMCFLPIQLMLSLHWLCI